MRKTAMTKKENARGGRFEKSVFADTSFQAQTFRVPTVAIDNYDISRSVVALVIVHRAERAWWTLAVRADLSTSCDARRRAKLAKSRKKDHRVERRSVRQMMKEAATA